MNEDCSSGKKNNEREKNLRDEEDVKLAKQHLHFYFRKVGERERFQKARMCVCACAHVFL